MIHLQEALGGVTSTGTDNGWWRPGAGVGGGVEGCSVGTESQCGEKDRPGDGGAAAQQCDVLNAPELHTLNVQHLHFIYILPAQQKILFTPPNQVGCCPWEWKCLPSPLLSLLQATCLHRGPSPKPGQIPEIPPHQGVSVLAYINF